MKKVAVIGGGPAGMMAAIAAAGKGAEVTLYEKNEKLGKKLFITGKGRCNLTNACPLSDFFANIVHNEKFLYSALYAFTNADAMEFFESGGLRLKTERGNRVFPLSDHSSDVIRTLERELKRLGVTVRLNSVVKDIESLDADAVIIATGGLSYPSTGSTGDGYAFAKSLGHTVKTPVPALCPVKIKESFAAELEGLSLRNVRADIYGNNNKKLWSGFGEMLFTGNGVSGPLVLTASSLFSAEIASGQQLRLSLDLKPALDEATLNERMLRDFQENINREFKNSLGKLLPSKLIPVMVRRSGTDPEKRVNEITKAERLGLVKLFKNFDMTITESGGFSQAVITAGGVNVKEINPSTMESKLRKGVYFAGEVLDVDAFTGGFNIQIALSTGRLAGISAAEI